MYQCWYHQVGLYCVEGTAEVYEHNLDKTLCLFKVLINVVCQGQQCIFNPSLWAICKLVWVWSPPHTGAEVPRCAFHARQLPPLAPIGSGPLQHVVICSEGSRSTNIVVIGFPNVIPVVLWLHTVYGPDAHDPLFVLTMIVMIVTSIHSYFMYCQALCLRFSHFPRFIYCHCSLAIARPSSILDCMLVLGSCWHFLQLKRRDQWA